jgi:hypothetical protein
MALFTSGTLVTDPTTGIERQYGDLSETAKQIVRDKDIRDNLKLQYGPTPPAQVLQIFGLKPEITLAPAEQQKKVLEAQQAELSAATNKLTVLSTQEAAAYEKANSFSRAEQKQLNSAVETAKATGASPQEVQALQNKADQYASDRSDASDAAHKISEQVNATQRIVEARTTDVNHIATAEAAGTIAGTQIVPEGNRAVTNTSTLATIPTVGGQNPADSANPDTVASLAKEAANAAKAEKDSAYGSLLVAQAELDMTTPGTPEHEAAQEALNFATNDYARTSDNADLAEAGAQSAADAENDDNNEAIADEPQDPTEGYEGEEAEDEGGEPEQLGLSQSEIDEKNAADETASETRLRGAGLNSNGSRGASSSAFDTNRAVSPSNNGMSFDADWRVRMVLPTTLASRLCTGIMEPLKGSGVVFPYTPNITVTYAAEWTSQKLTHSNYAAQFYNSSEIQDIQLQGMFTAQNQIEAEMMLAILTFGKMVTKMFFGESTDAGSPPPVLHLYGHGDYQWKKVPIVVKNFTYNLSADVDYIPVKKYGNTRVPSQIDNMSFTVAPIYSREQVRKFDMKTFASGELIKGGFI